MILKYQMCSAFQTGPWKQTPADYLNPNLWSEMFCAHAISESGE